MLEVVRRQYGDEVGAVGAIEQPGGADRVRRCTVRGVPADPAPGRGGMRVHHYWTRDEEFLLGTKLPRAAETKGWELTPEAVDFHRTAYDDVEDPQIRRFLPGLRERLGRAR